MNSADREFRKHVQAAERSLRQAADVCVSVVNAGKKSVEKPEVRRARSSIAAIEMALRRLATMGRMFPLYDLTDPDLIPAAERKPARVENAKTE